jgi:hypothetical protein
LKKKNFDFYVLTCYQWNRVIESRQKILVKESYPEPYAESYGGGGYGDGGYGGGGYDW